VASLKLIVKAPPDITSHFGVVTKYYLRAMILHTITYKFKVASLVHQLLSGQAPLYLSRWQMIVPCVQQH